MLDVILSAFSIACLFISLFFLTLVASVYFIVSRGEVFLLALSETFKT